MATPVYVLTVNSFRDPSFYLVFDELEKAQLAAKIYENGISSMTEEEFAEYVSSEEERYRKKKEESTKKAIERAREYREDALAAMEERNETCKA
jgi:hypothetical protein